MKRPLQIGVLALQGDFAMHEKQIRAVGAEPHLVKLPRDLESLDLLIIPGGESTTMSILLDQFALREPLRQFARTRPVFGTCAGMIMLAKEIEDNQSGVKTLGLMDISVVRNGYGRQVHSFEETISVHVGDETRPVQVAFIRAPRITRLGPEVEVLAVYKDSPVMVRQGNLAAASFHAELTEDTSLLQGLIDVFLRDTSNPNHILQG